MSLFDACGWSALRAATVVLMAAPICVLLVRILRSREDRGEETRIFRIWSIETTGCLFWTLLLIPFLTPDLLVGYAYGNFSPLPLVHHPWLCELLYGLLLWMKLVPVGTVVLYFSPPSPLSAEAIHCRRLSLVTRGVAGVEAKFSERSPQAARSPGASCGRPQPPNRLKRYAALFGDIIRGPARRMFPALGLMFLLAFQEFELGSLLGITAGRVGSPLSWTRTLFESQQGIIDRFAPLKWSLWPVLIDLAILVPLIWVTVHNRDSVGTTDSPKKPAGRVARLAAWSYLTLATVAVSILPLLFVLRESTDGFSALLASGEQLAGLFREILVGCAFACVAGLSAYFIAAASLGLRLRGGWWPGLDRREVPESGEPVIGEPGLRKDSSPGHPCRAGIKTLWRYFAALLLIPGLAGSLIVGLSILYLFQTDWLHRLYDTPIPLGIALLLFLAPRALLLQLLFRAARTDEPVRLARLLANSPARNQRQAAVQLLWSLHRSRHFWSIALLALWAYWDLTSAAMLHPSSMVPASIRLYNLMHYGHNAVLSAMTLFAVAVPLLMISILVSIIRPLSGRLV